MAATANITVQCGICLEDVTNNTVLDGCDHQFCYQCIFTWSNTSNTCPMCKARFYKLTKPKLLASAPQESKAEPKDTEEPKQNPKKRPRTSTRGAPPTKRAKTDGAAETETISVPHRDQRSDHYELNPFGAGGGLDNIQALAHMFIHQYFHHMNHVDALLRDDRLLRFALPPAFAGLRALFPGTAQAPIDLDDSEDSFYDSNGDSIDDYDEYDSDDEGPCPNCGRYHDRSDSSASDSDQFVIDADSEDEVLPPPPPPPPHVATAPVNARAVAARRGNGSAQASAAAPAPAAPARAAPNRRRAPAPAPAQRVQQPAQPRRGRGAPTTRANPPAPAAPTPPASNRPNTRARAKSERKDHSK